MRRLLAAILLSAAQIAPAAAAQIRYDFTGTFTTSDTTSSFATEGGFTSGTGSYSGFVIFDTSEAGPDFTDVDAFLSIGNYAIDFADPLASFAGANVVPPDLTLTFLSTEDFSAANSFELLSFQIRFPTATSGIVQNPDPASGTVDVNFSGDADALYGSGVVTSFDVSQTTAVPEPGSWALMIGGFGLIGGALRFGARNPRSLTA